MINIIKKIVSRFTPEVVPNRIIKRSGGAAKVTDREIESARLVNLMVLIERLGMQATNKREDKATFLSPLRSETSPSFTVNYYRGRWTWKDWGSGDSGDAISFVQSYYNLDFLEAVKKLNGDSSYDFTPPPPQAVAAAAARKAESAEWVRNLHKKKTGNVRPNELAMMKEYFAQKGVKYHEEMGCFVYYQTKENRKFVAIPTPFAENISGIECKEIGGSNRHTVGDKGVWLLRRSRRAVVTESIMDALAAEIVLDDETLTLISINGSGMTEYLPDLFNELRPEELLFAMDNDAPGRGAQQKAMQIALAFCNKLQVIDDHVRAGVKDMHKLIELRAPARIKMAA